MTLEEAEAVLLTATRENAGTFTVLRLGEDPGAQRVHQLRLALRVLWRHGKSKDALPFEITTPAAVILHLRSECERNLCSNKSALRRELESELEDLSQGAFELLCGRDADANAVRRRDLGE